MFTPPNGVNATIPMLACLGRDGVIAGGGAYARLLASQLDPDRADPAG